MDAEIEEKRNRKRLSRIMFNEKNDSSRNKKIEYEESLHRKELFDNFFKISYQKQSHQFSMSC